jgi:hypothetical protein
MFFSDLSYIGIDPTAGQRPFAYVAIDHDLHLLALSQGYLDDVLAFAAGQRRAYIAICAPRQPNQGLMEKPDVRERFSPPPKPGRWVNFRLAEYQLRQYNIRCPKTPALEDRCPTWMRVGFSLFRRLAGLGYRPYPAGEHPLQTLEVYPHACFSGLLGVKPFEKHTIEGRIQRQMILYDLDLRIPDPMHFFEEITRHRLMQGILPENILYSPGELDALVAAYTAWLAANTPDRTLAFGDREEGQIILPVAELKRRY